MPSFDEWFKRATGNDPFPYQRRFAEGTEIPQLVDVPTGLGKTAMVVLGWLWRRRFAESEKIRKATPRRLVYCLPMRVLVEQTVTEAKKWVAEIKKHYPKEMTQPLSVYTLMVARLTTTGTDIPKPTRF
jgi:CRISPR-associated endonuclease/helicase Cas3